MQPRRGTFDSFDTLRGPRFHDAPKEHNRQPGAITSPSLALASRRFHMGEGWQGC